MNERSTRADPIAPLRTALRGRYEIQRELGQGAFATVYLARDCRHERSVAIKVLNADPTSEAGELRFIREIRLLAGLQHPHILPLHDSGHVEELLYYVMPYVSGETLRARMSRERRLAIDAAVAIAREAADALACAHGQGIIHRDIKPENILLSGGHAIVADFGIARAIDIAGVRQLTRTGMGGPGTPAYMSPEQLLGDHPLDGRSDIYSLGCVLYEMLTGKPPFAGKEGFVKRFTEPAPLPSSIRKEVEPWIDAAISTALARNPVDRYATAGELVRALTRYSTGDSSAPFARGASYQRSTPPTERNSYGSSAGVATDVQQASIGVLPFTNMSTDPANEYFSDGITEEILNALMRLPALKVAARSSSFALKGQSLSIGEIGERLKVSTVLEGSVRRVNQRVRITAQLINTADGYHLWSERYDRDVEDVFAIQDEIARTIVDHLKVKLTPAESQAIGKRQTDNVEAYELYLRGRHCWNRWHLWGMMRKAMGYYEEALEKDPEYALAYHGLADAYNILGLYAFAPAKEIMPQAKAAALKAVELAPELAETRASLGFVHMLSWDWKAADATLRQAIDLNPRYGSARSLRAWLLTILGRHPEAIEEVRRGQSVDPSSHGGGHGIAALVLYNGRQYDSAIAECERVLEVNPTDFQALNCISLSYAAKGEYDQAIRHAERGVGLAPDSDFLRALLGAVYGMAGENDAARGILSDLTQRSERTYVAPILMSWIYASLRDRENAFEWLDKAYAERTCTLGLGIDFALYDGIRDDPRFEDLRRKLGLT